jgi:hypothetical protein
MPRRALTDKLASIVWKFRLASFTRSVTCTAPLPRNSKTKPLFRQRLIWVRYLCGFTLFLSLILNRTYTFILDILRLETTVKELRAATAKAAKDENLAEVIAKKDKEIAGIKAQAEGLSHNYSELSDKYEALLNKDTPQIPKKDL